jgi:CO/xanthine dehydrogenase FAD-binding subunit
VPALTPRFLRPRSLKEALDLLSRSEDCRVLAGGTDLMVMLHAGVVRPKVVLDVWSLPELKGIRTDDGFLEVGAAEPYAGIIGSPQVERHCPALVEAARTIGAVQIQSRGTLGGNLANASPAGDTLPVMLAADAEVVTDRRRIPVAEFFTGYRKTALSPGELIVAVRFPVGRQLLFRKVGTRAAQAISKVVLAVCREPARIAVGSVAEVPLRAKRAEAVLEKGGKTGEVVEVVKDEIRPIDDVRSTAEYRRAVTANVLRRLLTGPTRA